ncbi:HGGxSTG domain-containing protein [Moraxella catarrhalis]|uniref:HGGxSTG domain-containing protein n=1 Tax=Moraxella catarrhalis TaxID=480 RepID=UPI00160384A3|nr:HGGxSTG domain-containing protein [Moraxella catarrhalis]
MAFCGAKTRSGHTCKNSAMANGRCRLHGGKSTGPKNNHGNQNAKKHGIYAKFITDDEWQAVEKSELDTLDDELRLCKVRLLRALQAENKQGNLGDEALELIRKTVEPPIIGGVPIMPDDDDDMAEIVKKSFEKRDYNSIIDRLIGRIQSLTVTRQDLVSKSIDIELKQIELDKVKLADEKTQAKPTQIVINVQDGRRDAKTDAKPEHTTS